VKAAKDFLGWLATWIVIFVFIIAAWAWVLNNSNDQPSDASTSPYSQDEEWYADDRGEVDAVDETRGQ
jgi:hypothetical protein